MNHFPILSLMLRRTSLAALLVAGLTLIGTAGGALAQNNALRLGPTNTNTYASLGSTCSGGTNAGAVCSVASQCPGGTCVAGALGAATFTVETWFMRQGTGVPTSTGTGGIAAFLPLLTKGAAQAEGSNVDANYLLGINTAGNVIAADFEQLGLTCGGGTGNCSTSPFGPGCTCAVNADCNSGVCWPAGQNHPISGVTPIVNGVWYHAAATYDGTTWRLYLNGELEVDLVVQAPARSDSVQHAALGTTIRSDTLVPNGFFDGTLDEARVWNTARSATDIRSTMNVQNPSDPALLGRWGLNEGAGTAVGDSAGTPQNGIITGTNTSWVTGATFDIAPCANNPSSMLRFDGTNDYVTFGGNTCAGGTNAGAACTVASQCPGGACSELGLSTFTLETWFKREGTGVSNTTGTGGVLTMLPLVTKGAPEGDGSNVDANYVLGINTTGNVLAADFEDSATGLNHPVSGTTVIVNNNWYHAAATYDGTTWRLYLNGNLEATLVVGAFTPRSDSIQHAALGAMVTSAGTRLGAFQGVLDEVRIWNVARSQVAIQNDMLSELTSGTGLLARWGLAEGTGATIADSVGATFITGTLTNGPTWTASNSLFAANASCDDTTFCNGADTCNGNGVLAGPANTLRCTINAGDPCAGGAECNDSCNEAADNCFNVATSCTADGNVCTNDVCDGAGACGVPNTDPCDDEIFCNGDDTCSGGTCGAHTGDPCVGGTECNDACNEGADSCADASGTACTADTNVCTNDQCDGAGACAHPNNTAPCDDTLFCNGTDTCSGGTCGHTGDPCVGGTECNDACNEGADSCADASGTACTADTNVCTDDQCNGAGACAHPNNTAPCDDTLFCNGTDTCSGGTCGHAGDPCVGGTECNDACNEGADSCAIASGTACTADTNVCTNDQCDGAGVCAHPNNTAPCDDTLFCNGTDTCSAGTCGHAGDPCAGGTECNDACNEGADSCADASGTACAADTNVCTNDQCDGAGVCAHPNNTAPCDDTLFCTGTDTCSGGTCGHTGDPCVGGTECNDACNEGADSCADASGTACTADTNVCTNDQCDGAGVCAHPNNIAPCDDTNTCTENDTCSAGVCAGTSGQCGDGTLQGGCAEECDDGNMTPGDGCDASCQFEPCAPTPATGCLVPAVIAKAQLKIKRGTVDTKDQLQWKWSPGAATTVAEFGDPTTSESYYLCVYDNGQLVSSTTMPAAGTCADKACWKASSTGYQYKDKDLTPDGGAQLKLKAGVATKAQAQFKGKGADLETPALPLTGPVRVQLKQTSGTVCWEATYSSPFLKNDGTSGSFLDKAD